MSGGNMNCDIVKEFANTLSEQQKQAYKNAYENAYQCLVCRQGKDCHESWDIIRSIIELCPRYKSACVLNKRQYENMLYAEICEGGEDETN